MAQKILWSVLSCMAALPAGAATYSFVELERYSFTSGSGVSQEYSINDKGIIFDQTLVFSNNRSNEFLRSRDSDNLGQEDLRGGVGGYPQGNNAGSVLGSTSDFVVRNGQSFVVTDIVVSEPDGSKRIVAQVSSADHGDGSTPFFKEIYQFGASINDRGDVAAHVRTFEDEFQIVKFYADGSHEVLVTDATGFPEPGEVGFSISDRVVINNNGSVAFVASEFNSNGNTLSQGYWIAEDADSLRQAVPAPDNVALSGDFDFNDDGDFVFLATESSGLRTQIGFFDAATGATTVEDLGARVEVGELGSLNLNKSGQTAYTLNGELYVDGEKILGLGDTPIGELEPLVRSGQFSPVGLREKVSFNDRGQVVVNIQTGTLDPETGARVSAAPSNFTILVNPPGASVDNPLMPFSSSPAGENDVALNIINGLGVDAPIWVDPIVATGFTYSQGSGGENFASLIIPEALPLGDDSFVLEFLYGAGSLFSDVLGVGMAFDFTAYDPLGISEFTISGIDIAEAVEPTDPFVVGLTFVAGDFQSTLSIDAITVDTDAPSLSAVPLPAPSLLLLFGVASLVGAGLGRRRL